MLYKFYVMMRRVFSQCPLTHNDKEKFLNNGTFYDYVNIYSTKEAIESNWIDEEGNRTWCVNPCDEGSPTFLWGFNDEDEAINFACSLKNEIGIKIEG